MQKVLVSDGIGSMPAVTSIIPFDLKPERQTNKATIERYMRVWLIISTISGIALLLLTLGAHQVPNLAEEISTRSLDADLGGGWHEVSSDETLRSIARTYYGSGRAWRTIQIANDVGQCPKPGSRLWIPACLPASFPAIP